LAESENIPRVGLKCKGATINLRDQYRWRF